MIIANSGRIYTCLSSTRQVNPGRIVLDTPPVKNIRDWNTWVNGQNGNQLDAIKQPFTKLHEQAILSSRLLFCRFKQTITPRLCLIPALYLKLSNVFKHSINYSILVFLQTDP